MGTEHAFAWRDGVVHWTREGSGPPVVLCHGTPWSSWLWEGVARALAPRWTVYRWDLLGYGRSEQREGQDVSLGAQGELFAALLDHWRLDEPTVIAHDYGGAIALRAHLLHGRSYAALGLVDVVALAPWGSPFFRLVGQHTPVFTQLPVPLHEALVRAYIAGASHRGLDGDTLDQLVAPWIEGSGPAAFYRQIAQADQRFTDEIEPRYPELDLPVHIVWGAQDTWIPLAQGERLHGLIPGSTFEVIEDAGHLIQLDQPAALAGSLVRWLADGAQRRLVPSAVGRERGRGPTLEPVAITDAVPEDAGEILTLQRAAYVTEAQLHDDPNLPPLLQTLDQLRDEFTTSTFLMAVQGTRIVGAVRGRLSDGALHIGRLVVAPDQQRRGIGTLLLDALELRFADEVDRFELFTGARSEANLRLYQRLGYRETRREPIGERVTLVHLTKDATAQLR